jgi:hypothetical protein
VGCQTIGNVKRLGREKKSNGEVDERAVERMAAAAMLLDLKNKVE